MSVNANLQLKNDTTANVAAYTGPVGEIVIDNQLNLAYIQDGVTPGGHLIGSGTSAVTQLLAGTNISLSPSDGLGSVTINADTGDKTIVTAFSYGDVSPELLYTIPAGKFVTSAQIIVTTSFNGSSAALSIGDSSNNSSVMSNQQNNPGAVGQYATNRAAYYASSTAINLYITPGSGAFQGSGYVILTTTQ